MAPPTKRRRLFFWEEDEQPPQPASTPSFSHTVTQLEPKPMTSTMTVEELHIQVRDRYLKSVEERETYLQRLRRQDSVSLAAESATSASGTEAAPLSSTPTSSSTPTLSSTASSASTTLPSSVSSTTATSGANASTQSSLTSVGNSISSPAVPTQSGIASSTASPLGSLNGNITASNSTPSFSGSISNTAFPTSAGHNLTATAIGFPSASGNSSFGTASSSLTLLATYSLTQSSSTTSSTSDSDNVATSLIYSTATLSQDGHPVSTITTAIGVAGYGPQAIPSTSSTPSTSNNGSRPDPPPPGTIAGGVVGGAAGLAVLLLVAMLFLRWYRRKRRLGHQPLAPGSAGLSSGIDQGPSPRDGPGMAERAGLLPLAAAVPALFRHQPRSYPDQSLGPSLGPERGFQRVSGRKLPSAFSEGMVSAPPPSMPLVAPEHNASSASLYNDRSGNTGGGAPNPFADRPDSTSPDSRLALGHRSSSEQMTVVPGPERRPTVHHAGPYTLAPGASQINPGAVNAASPIRTSGTAASLHRSETPVSMEGSRGSRFLEEV